MNEEWRPIPGYEGLYSVSSLGNLRREEHPTGYGARVVKQRVLIGSVDRGGYRWVYLNKSKDSKFFLVHRIVALAFLGDPTGLEVNHKNGIKDDNRVENLELVTAAENTRHKIDVLRLGIGDTCGTAKLIEANIVPIRRLYNLGVNESTIADAFGVSTRTIEGVLSQRCWGHVKETA